MIWDTFIFNDELDMLRCRLEEFEDYQEPVIHVLAEATVDHRGQPKPLHYQQARQQFWPWNGRIFPVVASPLPAVQENPDPWSREHAQREYCRAGLFAASQDDIVLHGDVDEIPRISALAQAVARVRSMDSSAVVLGMRQHMYAADWLYPDLSWPGTIVTTNLFDTTNFWPVGFSWLRDQRNVLPRQEDGGWHLSWMGGPEAHRRKLDVHCHLEMTPEEAERPRSGLSYREGITHGGTVQLPVRGLSDYPRYVRERRCPASWFRPK